jgi:hypothetical protein
VLDLGSSTITSSTTGLGKWCNWHHLAVSFPSAANSSGAAKLYVNGTGTNGSGTTTINTNSSKDVIIGRDGDAGSVYFNGQIDDVRFYDGEMNSTLISQLYGNGNGDFNRLKIKAGRYVTLTAPNRVIPATPLPHRLPCRQLSTSPTRRFPSVRFRQVCG